MTTEIVTSPPPIHNRIKTFFRAALLAFILALVDCYTDEYYLHIGNQTYRRVGDWPV